MQDDGDDPDDGPALLDRFTIFFDFLGSSEATKWPKARLYPFLDLLIAIAAQMQTAQHIDGGRQADDSFRFSITPEVTAFSDNIVVSYPWAADETDVFPDGSPPMFVAMWTTFMCRDAIRVLSGVAEMALRIGVLIRGGFTFGQLYHENGVVFGEAMVEAHDLEDTQAVTPRVLVSNRILERLALDPAADRSFLLQDADGRWHLNYFARMIDNASDSPMSEESARAWKSAHFATIDREIAAASKASIAEKWTWFKTHFEDATAHINGDER